MEFARRRLSEVLSWPASLRSRRRASTLLTGQALMVPGRISCRWKRRDPAGSDLADRAGLGSPTRGVAPTPLSPPHTLASGLLSWPSAGICDLFREPVESRISFKQTPAAVCGAPEGRKTPGSLNLPTRVGV